MGIRKLLVCALVLWCRSIVQGARVRDSVKRRSCCHTDTGNYRLVELLGSGTFANVYQVEWHSYMDVIADSTGASVAIPFAPPLGLHTSVVAKLIKAPGCVGVDDDTATYCKVSELSGPSAVFDQGELRGLRNECSHAREAKGNARNSQRKWFIDCKKGLSADPNSQAFMLFEVGSKDNLGDAVFLPAEHGGVPLFDRRRLFLQVIGAISVLQRSGMSHRDLKFQNILAMDDYEGVHPELIDFGVSHHFPGEKPTSFSPAYMPWWMTRGLGSQSQTQTWEYDIHGVGQMLLVAELLRDVSLYGLGRAARREMAQERRFKSSGGDGDANHKKTVLLMGKLHQYSCGANSPYQEFCYVLFSVKSKLIDPSASSRLTAPEKEWLLFPVSEFMDYIMSQVFSSRDAWKIQDYDTFRHRLALIVRRLQGQRARTWSRRVGNGFKKVDPNTYFAWLADCEDGCVAMPEGSWLKLIWDLLRQCPSGPNEILLSLAAHTYGIPEHFMTNTPIDPLTNDYHVNAKKESHLSASCRSNLQQAYRNRLQHARWVHRQVMAVKRARRELKKHPRARLGDKWHGPHSLSLP